MNARDGWRLGTGISSEAVDSGASHCQGWQQRERQWEGGITENGTELQRCREDMAARKSEVDWRIDFRRRRALEVCQMSGSALHREEGVDRGAKLLGAHGFGSTPVRNTAYPAVPRGASRHRIIGSDGSHCSCATTPAQEPGYSAQAEHTYQKSRTSLFLEQVGIFRFFLSKCHVFPSILRDLGGMYGTAGHPGSRSGWASLRATRWEAMSGEVSSRLHLHA